MLHTLRIFPSDTLKIPTLEQIHGYTNALTFRLSLHLPTPCPAPPKKAPDHLVETCIYFVNALIAARYMICYINTDEAN